MLASWEKIAQKIRVPVGRLGAVTLLFMHPDARSLAIGGAIAGLGALLRIWAAGYIEKGKSLATAGPYARTRNPLYLGSLIMGAGVLIAGRIYWFLLPFVALYLLLYIPVMKREEQELHQGYGDAFPAYAGRVPMFFPRFFPAPGTPSKFLWSRVKRNREHRHLLALLIAELFLIAKSIYWP
jgi:protein-S-isoprenylcysteine O-methyltransferase Ste14